MAGNHWGRKKSCKVNGQRGLGGAVLERGCWYQISSHRSLLIKLSPEQVMPDRMSRGVSVLKHYMDHLTSAPVWQPDLTFQKEDHTSQPELSAPRPPSWNAGPAPGTSDNL